MLLTTPIQIESVSLPSPSYQTSNVCPRRGFRPALATYPPRTATALVGLLQALLTELTILCISMTGCQLNLSSFLSHVSAP